MYVSYSRLLAFCVALAGMVALYLFLSRTYIGTAIRAIAQDRQIMPLMGVDSRKIYMTTSAVGGGLAGLAASLLVLQYDVHPFIGLTFGPITFMICVMGGLGNMIGGFVAAFLFAEIISVGGLWLDLEWGYVFAFMFFIAMMFFRRCPCTYPPASTVSPGSPRSACRTPCVRGHRLLRAAGGLRVVADAADAARFADAMLADPAKRDALGRAGERAAARHAGLPAETAAAILQQLRPGA